MAGGFPGQFADPAALRASLNNDPLGAALFNTRWNPVAAALVEGARSFNPSSRGGLLNLASIFAGGGDFTGEGGMGMENPGLPGHFEAYTMSKSPVRFSEGQSPGMSDLLRYANHSPNVGQRVSAASMIHDMLFGGEVHAKGSIPERPSEVHARNLMADIRQRSGVEPPKNTEDVVQQIADKLGVHPSKVEAQMRAASQGHANTAHQAYIARVLHNHGFSPRPAAHLREALDQHEQAALDTSQTRSSGQKAGASRNIFHPAARASRQAALRELLKQHFNHPN